MNKFLKCTIAVFGLACLAGCYKTATAGKNEEPKPQPNVMEIRAGESLMKRVKLGEPSMAQVAQTITVAARVEIDQSKMARVGSPVMGRITELNVQEGQQVERGDVIAVVNSTSLSDTQLALLKALSQVQFQQRAVERGEVLLQGGVIGAAELRRREAELAQATAELTAAKDQLHILGISDEAVENLEKTHTINSLLRVTATADGTIFQRHVAPGQVIQPADTFVEIADLSSLWLVADIPEQSAGNVTAGQSAEAEIEALPGDVIRGRLSFVSAMVNAETRTVRVRMDLPNPRQRYKPAMLATMTVRDHNENRQVIPSSAVVREGNQEHVFVQTGEDRFLLRPVTLGAEQGGMRVLIDGIRPGERIVVDGAFHLNAERKRAAVEGS